MRLLQEFKFHLQLSLSESYIYGTATMNDKYYSINIQQAKNQFVVLPRDFSGISEPYNALISFSTDDDNNSNNKRISMTSEIQVGQGDLIEVYLDQDDMLLSLAKDLPVEITIRMYTTSPANNEGR
ncbi:MAG: hypothetical protein WA326_09210 [Nitrososphaeraceae archaeon]